MAQLATQSALRSPSPSPSFSVLLFVVIAKKLIAKAFQFPSRHQKLLHKCLAHTHTHTQFCGILLGQTTRKFASVWKGNEAKGGGRGKGCRLCVIKNCHTQAEASDAVTRNEILQNDVIALFIAPHKSCQCRFAASTLVSLRIRHVAEEEWNVWRRFLFFTLAKAHNFFYVVSLPFVALFTAAIYLASSVAAHTHTYLQLYTHTDLHTPVYGTRS